MHTEGQMHTQDAVPTTGRLAAATGAAIMATGAAFVAYVDPTRLSFIPICPLFAMTGFACPGCGLTRAFHALLTGDIIPALDFNILVPVWAVIFGYSFVSLVLLAVRGRGLPMWPTWPRFLWTFMIVLLTFGVVRNIPIWPLTILFP
ncbi:MAG: DUF2752 domain-containing protein [Pyrinomonadaceae bacterium]